ncbi:cytochrome P450 26A1 isoform X2 [Oreochromis niloticus]|uniref:cytochrome P450 26A1 isoform X2 n=1 Tax=Oreochromis niloticus TaxID=8128 RepID=UPI0003940D17|nr:cytochrome P450 26A1 isoform X2 [Oreochromis niloticus]
MVVNALLTTFLCTVALPILLFLLAVKLWEVYTLRCRDPTCPFPLPPGSMGLPFIGETLQLLLQRKTFLRMKREKYGYIYRTHLFGNRTVRVTGADNVKQILLGEHRLVSAQWPASVRAILGTETLSNVHGAQHKTKKKGLKARNFIHSKIEENIKKKVQESDQEWKPRDALQQLIDSSNKNKEPISMQAIKQSATELLFGGHETTASTATSLVMFLGLNPKVVDKLRQELEDKAEQGMDLQSLNIESLEQLKYTGCVIKETLRINPPVPGGFRVALKTFELNGYQIPKGWNVVYSICDTHDVAEIFPDKEDFQPERFMTDPCADSSRFQYIPFGGGSRMCIGKEFAKVLLKVFLVEVVTKCHWTLLNGPPTMKTGPTVYPEDNLPTKFTSYVQT